MEKRKMIKKVEIVNGHSREIWMWNRPPTEEEFKRGIKGMEKIMDKVVAREKAKEQEAISNFLKHFLDTH